MKKLRKNNFGKFLISLRSREKISLRKMAERLNIKPPMLSMYESGVRAIPLEIFSKITDEFFLSELEKKKLSKAIGSSVPVIMIDTERCEVIGAGEINFFSVIFQTLKNEAKKQGKKNTPQN